MTPEEQNTALAAIAEQARATAGADRCTIFQFDRARNEVFSRVAQGLAVGEEIRLPTSRGVIGFVARTGRTLRLRDVYNDPRFDPSTDQRTGYRTKSMLCVPAVDTQGNVLGAIQLINKASGPFTPEEEETATQFCAQIVPLLAPTT
ncbi:MAG: adenylate/guanylate cyclase [Chloroflexi bacterium]|nr:adenylate/guanylate cyclase [Chloroflexota bacterium]